MCTTINVIFHQSENQKPAGEAKPIRKSLDQHEATDLILKGRCVLDTQQSTPPMHLLDQLEKSIAEIERVGPQAIDGRVLGRIEEAVLKDGKRRMVVEDHLLEHLDGGHRAVASFWKRMTKCQQNLDDFRQSLSDCIAWQSKAATTTTVYQEPTPEDMVEEGIVYLNKGHRQYECSIVGQDWARFSLRVGELKEFVIEQTRRCLADGRLIAFQNTGRSPLLYQPDMWRNVWSFDISSYTRQYFYIFSADLPQSWFQKSHLPHNSASKPVFKNAADHLLELYERYEAGNGKRYKRDEAIENLKAQFNISKNKASDIWKNSDLPKWKKGGRVSSMNPQNTTQ
ncbi:MAG: hypothetical protein HRU33_08605 [Rhodobacteraceae bacterium]|nr:hypothetical protein [Paracoccaceae bacterium]